MNIWNNCEAHKKNTIFHTLTLCFLPKMLKCDLLIAQILKSPIFMCHIGNGQRNFLHKQFTNDTLRRSVEYIRSQAVNWNTKNTKNLSRKKSHEVKRVTKPSVSSFALRTFLFISVLYPFLLRLALLMNCLFPPQSVKFGFNCKTYLKTDFWLACKPRYAISRGSWLYSTCMKHFVALHWNVLFILNWLQHIHSPSFSSFSNISS